MLERLLQAGILDYDESAGSYAVSESFREGVDRNRADLDEDAIVDAVQAFIDDERARATADLGEPANEFVSTLRTVESTLEDISTAERLQIATVLETIEYEPPEPDGSPAPFLSVSPEQLRILLQFHHKAVVYVWREDCSPCDKMRETLASVFADPPEGLSLFSVYGPESPDLLADEFDVIAGPTTLFVVNGSVDCRLHGAHHQEPVKTQTEILLDL